MSYEQLFASSVLNVIVPDTTIQYPPKVQTDEWLARLKSGSAERNQAFFDEQLQLFLTASIGHPTPESPADPEHPPQVLLGFLAHLQVSLEATYISSVPVQYPDSPRTSRLSAPPRLAVLAKSSARFQNHHPSILPPSTPNPTPSSADHDRPYIASEGTLLLASIWGQNAAEGSQEAFTLLWSDDEQAWIAVYRLALTVSFLRLRISDPLLCLTVSATLREKPLNLTQTNLPLARYFASMGVRPNETVPETPTAIEESPVELSENALEGLAEVNLLEGLLAGPTFSNGMVSLSSTRLGTVSRQKLFSLPPVSFSTIETPSPSPMTAIRTTHPTLRKSFRKTLHTVSGFRVRMRTVFVPYVLLPELEGVNLDMNDDEDEDERERREAGNQERTVILCVEIENSGESASDTGFLVEKVDVSIGGEGAKATLIAWGDICFSKDAEEKTFPLHVESMAQYNLLYAVSFLRSPEEVEGFSLSQDSNSTEKSPTPASSELQRAVTINIFGKPYVRKAVQESASYPTQTYTSRWNCVLDLSVHRNTLHDTQGTFEDSEFVNVHNVLPEPASPFPVYTPRTASLMSPGGDFFSANTTPQPSATAGRKRHTLPSGNIIAARSMKAATPNRASTSMLNPGYISISSKEVREREQPPLPGSSRMSYVPPSISNQPPRSPTTYGAPPPSSDPINLNNKPPPFHEQHLPTTPAYPAYPPLSAAPTTPMTQGPITSHTQGNVGPNVEIRRERGTGMSSVPGPTTPGPWVTTGPSEQKSLVHLQQAEETGESIVVSVGLLPSSNRARRNRHECEVVLSPGKIYPLDYFTLDIFVFNRSLWTRRFEITCSDRQKRHKGGDKSGYDGAGDTARRTGFPGILPLESRVRIGPLLPATCQSVRMEFLAITPGIHAIETLTLTDVESGYSMNLRSVADVAVHDPID